jgi:hypothetical protein
MPHVPARRYSRKEYSAEILASAHHRTSDFFEQGLLAPTFVIADVDFWDEAPRELRHQARTSAHGPTPPITTFDGKSANPR